MPSISYKIDPVNLTISVNDDQPHTPQTAEERRIFRRLGGVLPAPQRKSRSKSVRFRITEADRIRLHGLGVCWD